MSTVKTITPATFNIRVIANDYGPHCGMSHEIHAIAHKNILTALTNLMEGLMMS